MEINLKQDIEIDAIGTSSVIQAGIREGDVEVLVHILSTSFYSDPLGSFIREVASNAYDANKEAGVEEPVYIRLLYDLENDNFFLEFEDFGSGMSPEFMKNIFMNWVASTKRNNNTLLGGYGIGSKSPLAYTDQFYITTRVDGIEYKYILYKTDIRPELDLLGTKTVDKPNGTIVRVDLHKHETRGKIAQAIITQLIYFENLYVVGLDDYYDNNNQIVEGDTFIYSSKNTTRLYVHAVVGCVAYPLDWAQLEERAIPLPLGLKFNLGELDLTPNRENLRYTDKTKAAIKDKLQEFRKEIKERLSKIQIEFDNLREFLAVRNSPITLDLGIEQLELSQSAIEALEYKRDLAFKFTPLPDIEISNPFRLVGYKLVRVNKRNEISTSYAEISDDFLLNPKRYMYSKEKSVDHYATIKAIRDLRDFSTYRNYEIDQKHFSIPIITKPAMSVHLFRTIAENLKLGKYVRRKFLNIIPRKPRTNLEIDAGRTFIPCGTALKIYKYRKFFDKLLEEELLIYAKPSEEWIEEYKRELRELNRRKRVVRPSYEFTYYINGKRHTTTIKEFSNCKAVYFNYKDEDPVGYPPIDKLIQLMSNSPMRKFYRFITLAPTTAERLLKSGEMPNLKHVSTFLHNPDLTLWLAKSYLAWKFVNDYGGYYNTILNTIGRVSTILEEKYKPLQHLKDTYRALIDLNDYYSITTLDVLIPYLKKVYNKTRTNPRLYIYRNLIADLNSKMPQLIYLHNLSYEIKHDIEALRFITSRLKLLNLNQNLYKYGDLTKTSWAKSNPNN